MENRLTATGKRKNAIACVILKPGKGERIVNGHQIKDYLKSDTLIRKVEEPFETLESGSSYDLLAKCSGGGLSGQSGAIRLGIARALATLSDEAHKKMRKGGFLTRDSRVVERKKYGLAGARRRYQFSKR